MNKAVQLFVLGLVSGFLWSGSTVAKPLVSKDLLIKFRNPKAVTEFSTMAQDGGAKIETLGTPQWIRVQLTDQQLRTVTIEQIKKNPNVLHVQPNYPIRFPEDYRTRDPNVRARFECEARAFQACRERVMKTMSLDPIEDNPDLPLPGLAITAGADPFYTKQWGMNDIGAREARDGEGKDAVVVAVIDTGVDYTHEDLKDNIWRNSGEIPNNGIDDDHNGFIDDTIGWDFVSEDNKPYDLAVDPVTLVMMGGNPGHGTHCAGNIAAIANNGKGIAGVAPKAKIMPLRFLSERGSGTTSDAVRAIHYAIANGANIMSNSWGSEGDASDESLQNEALHDAIRAAQARGVLFVAAAGNGRQGYGYDNDSDPNPGVPASYKDDIIISVAAIDANNNLGDFSNWGKVSVDLAAPGVAVFSTMVGNNYSDTVVDMFGVHATWDGTSMATPHVAGAAALYWSAHPRSTWQEVKAAVLGSVKTEPGLADKLASGGKLNVGALMKP